MSTRVAVICEDPTYDQYLVKPVLAALLAAVGRPRAVVRVVDNPRARGDNQVISKACEFVERYRDISDAIVFVLDQDCEDGEEARRDKRARISNALAVCDPASSASTVVLAIQELEVWAIWGSRAALGVPWATVRDECHPKELYFEGLLTPADALTSDRGRARLIQASLSGGWQSMCSGCPELLELQERIAALVN